MRPTWIEVDLGAIRHNVATIARHVAPAEVMAVVKADGYGHGDVPVALAALEAGARSLAVALVSEGVRLREAGIDAPILLLSEPPETDIDVLREWAITPSVFRPEFITALPVGPEPLGVELVVDTGMHRVGIDPGHVAEFAAILHDHPGVAQQGTWTHLVVAEELDPFNVEQREAFVACLSVLSERGLDPGVAHLANTAGALYLEPGFDRVRVGLGIYGLYPDPSRRPVELRPAMRVVSHVSHVRRYPPGTRPSYGRVRSLERESNVATAPIGYADGVPRMLSQGDVGALLGGKRVPFAGNVTMDQILIDCGDDPVEVGDEIVLLGSQGAAVISADEWAAATGTISWEIVSRMGPRLPRRYLDGGTVVA